MKSLALLLIAILMLASSLAVHAQGNGAGVPPFATVEGGQLLLVDAQGNATAVATADGFNFLAWNDDGSQLAFIQHDAQFTPSLGVVDVASGSSTTLETRPLTAGFNLSWTQDGRILFATDSQSNDPAAGTGYKADLWAVQPVARAQPQQLGTIDFGVGCGGGSPIPADWVYWSETAGFGGFFLTLAATPYGIVVSQNCGGSSQGLFDPATGTLTVISSNLAKAVVSPDQARVAGVELNYQDRSASRLLVYDLATLSPVEIPTISEPDQLAWSTDGSSLLYSVRTPTVNLVADLTAEQQATLSAAFGSDVTDLPGFTSSIHRVDLATGEDTQLYSAYAHAVGRMIDTPDALYFSLVPNVDDWLHALLAGEVDMTTNESALQYVEPEVMRLASGASPDAVLLGRYQQFTPFVTG